MSRYYSFGNVFLQLIRIAYVIFLCTDPDWDGTATEQTDIHLLFHLPVFILKDVFFSIHVHININPPSQQTEQLLKLKLTISMSLLQVTAIYRA